MIIHAHRFHGYNSLRHVYSRGQVVRGQYNSLKYLVNPGRKQYRAAVVVSRKVNKSAVVRNRIRRRIYEIIRNNVPEDSLAIDLVFVLYSDQVASLEFSELQKQIVDQLIKAGVPAKPIHRDIIIEKEL